MEDPAAVLGGGAHVQSTGATTPSSETCRECIGWNAISSRVITLLLVRWPVLSPILLAMRTTREDEVLEREFGKEWEEYSRRTPCRLVPFVY